MILSLVSTKITEYGYKSLGDGYCGDWVYLPEGSYPALLNAGNQLYDADRKKECLNRCLVAYGKNGKSTSGGKIGKQAFYVNSDDGCACAVGECSARHGTGYASYEIISGNR